MRLSKECCSCQAALAGPNLFCIPKRRCCGPSNALCFRRCTCSLLCASRPVCRCECAFRYFYCRSPTVSAFSPRWRCRRIRNVAATARSVRCASINHCRHGALCHDRMERVDSRRACAARRVCRCALRLQDCEHLCRRAAPSGRCECQDALRPDRCTRYAATHCTRHSGARTGQLEGNVVQGELRLKGYSGSSPGYFKEGRLAPGSSKSDAQDWHNTGDVFRRDKPASSVESVRHVVCLEDMILLTLGRCSTRCLWSLRSRAMHGAPRRHAAQSS